MKKSLIGSIVAAASMGFAAQFNRMITLPQNAPVLLPEFTRANTRKRGLRTGIKGVKSSNMTSFGSHLKSHFESKNPNLRRNKMVHKAFVEQMAANKAKRVAA